MRTFIPLVQLMLLLSLSALLGVGCAAVRPIERYGMVIGVKKDRIPEYKRLHVSVWPGVLEMIKKCHIRNYSIYLAEIEPDQFYLFSYFEYAGDNFQGDMQAMAADATTQRWWECTKPLQRPLLTRQPGEWWAQWKEIFRYQGPPVKTDQPPLRQGGVIAIPKESILAYTQLHAAPWPGVIAAIEKSNIRNYSIYIGEVEKDQFYLFSYFEYFGDDFEKDMAEIAKDRVTQEWWKYTDPLQRPITTRKPGEHWHTMKEVFHTD